MKRQRQPTKREAKAARLSAPRVPARRPQEHEQRTLAKKRPELSLRVPPEVLNALGDVGWSDVIKIVEDAEDRGDDPQRALDEWARALGQRNAPESAAQARAVD